MSPAASNVLIIVVNRLVNWAELTRPEQKMPTAALKKKSVASYNLP